MQTAPDDFMQQGAGDGSDPSSLPPDPNAPPNDEFMSDQGADYDNATVAQSPHSAFMGGADSQHPGSDQMLTQDDTAVSPQEQHAYDDFVTRGLLFMHDSRVPAGKDAKPDSTRKAPRDVIIEHLNVKGLPADISVGRTTAQICWLIYSNALHQGVQYPPDVVYHGADEIMSHVYQIGVASGAIKNPPAPDSPQEQHLLGMAKLYATQFFGNNVIDAGLGDQGEARKFFQDQLQREHDTGSMDAWNPGQQMSTDQLTGFLARASAGKASLASMRNSVPSTISDFRARGAPSLTAASQAQAQQQAAAEQAPPDDGSGDQGGGDPNDPSAQAPPDDQQQGA